MVWRERFKQLMLSANKEVTVSHFYSPMELKTWYSTQPDIAASALYLCDYEFIGSSENGIELLTKLKINYLSILVTNRFNSEDVTSACEEQGIKLLPKDVISFIPIEIT